MDNLSEKHTADFSFKEMAKQLLEVVPHSKALGLEIVDADQEGVTLMLPYNENIIGNPDTGVIHGGALSALMDQTCGFAVACALAPNLDITPTIDLRIDHMRAAEPGMPLYAFAEVYRITSNVIFTRGVAFQNSKDDPLAHCVAAFMRIGIFEASSSSKKIK